MFEAQKLLDVLNNQNRAAREFWPKVQELGMIATNYLQFLATSLLEGIIILDKRGLIDLRLGWRDTVERIEKESRLFKDKISAEGGNLAVLLEILRNLLSEIVEAERLRAELYEKALMIPGLKKPELSKEVNDAIKVEVYLEPSDKIFPGKVMRGHIKIMNLSSLLQKLKLYIAWYHPTGIPSKVEFEKEGIELAPLSTISRICRYGPKAKGTYTLRVAVFKGTEEIASQTKTFEVIP